MLLDDWIRGKHHILSLLYVFIKPRGYLKSSYGASDYVFDYLEIYNRSPVQSILYWCWLVASSMFIVVFDRSPTDKN